MPRKDVLEQAAMRAVAEHISRDLNSIWVGGYHREYGVDVDALNRHYVFNVDWHTPKEETMIRYIDTSKPAERIRFKVEVRRITETVDGEEPRETGWKATIASPLPLPYDGEDGEMVQPEAQSVIADDPYRAMFRLYETFSRINLAVRHVMGDVDIDIGW